MAFVKQGPFRDVPALTAQPQQRKEQIKESGKEGGWNYTSKIYLTFNLAVQLRACERTSVCVRVCGGESEHYFRSEEGKKGLKNKLALCGNSFSQITQHSSTDTNAHKHPLTPSQLQHEGTVPHSHANQSWN